jgi:dipeptidyl aminopeptidase/acylaminoacyl peptidase
MLKLPHLAFACTAALISATPAAAKPPIEAFGDVPEIRAMEISPDGSKVAFLQRREDKDILAVYDFAAKTSKPLVSVTEIRARHVEFVGNNYVVLIASTDTRTSGYRGRYEFSAAFAFNLSTGKNVQLLRGTDGIYPAQGGLGRVVAVDPGGKHVFMPAYMGPNSADPPLDLLKVDLDNGRGSRFGGMGGNGNTVDWVVQASGAIIAREDFSEKRETHEIRAYEGNGNWRLIYTEKTPLPSINLVGVAADGKSLITVESRDSEFMSLYSMSLADGAVSGPLMQRQDAEVAGAISDSNRVVHGVLYSGMFPSYDMFDATIEAAINGVQNALPGSAVYLDSWSDDWSKMLFFVEGGTLAERYVMFDRTAKTLLVISNARPAIKPEDVGEVITIEYKARDGLKIPGLITWPTNVAPDARKKLPLVVMPHGGPEAYDAVGFDWLAQFIANEGYAVLQPNFRGSAGFGDSFRAAGRGEWGRKMQDDITDGVYALVKMGWADPERICIVGWSYGGYAALAGGALAPDTYKCVASIAGVSNLRDMLATERFQHGARSRTVTYWEAQIGDPDKDREAIDAVSPSRLGERFKAPVLLVHGTDDTVVPAKQSDMMNDALKSAKKDVQYIRIKGDDHGLVDNNSRRQVLQLLAEFLAKYVGKPG